MRDESSAKSAHYAPSRIIGLPALRDNYIWLIDSPVTPAFVVIDPGDAAPVLRHVAESGRQPAAVLVTHHHSDHVAGIAELLAHFPTVSVFGPAQEGIAGVNHPVSPGEQFDIAGMVFQVLDLSGHTRGQLGYVQETRLFCGDALFGLGCGRLFEGTPQSMLAALDRIAALPPEAEIYCAHEYTVMNLPFAAAVEPENRELARRATQIQAARLEGRPTVPLCLRDELQTNPFLRCDQPALIAAARRFDANVDGSDRVAVFAALRAWRNDFKG